VRFAHISDIQIRNFKRHWEFKKSFKNLYESLKQQKVDMIVLVGDVAHTKTQISPEFVQMCSSLFRSLSDIAPLVLIPGNHDGNLNNLDRLDALTPIVEALDRKNIFYLKNSGVYDHGLVDFVVFSCFDSEDKWPTIKDINKDKINIGLYHGMLQGVELQNGVLVDDAPHSMKDFLDKVDYLMLGDVHKMQLLDNTYRAAYCGSFPQQNYGETVEKGYLLWDVESKDKHEVDFVSLPNVCPFYTINFNGSTEGLDKLKIQKKSRIRVLCKQLDVFERQKLKDEINRLFEPKELKIIDESCADRQDIKLGALGVKIENLDDLTIQEKLIRHFLASNSLDEKLIQSILDINKKYNIQVRSDDDVLRNVQYKLTKMKWSNIGPYGENNEFDFSRHTGLLGVFGKNAVGKSSLAVDIPSYCIFNRISKNVTK
jgi:DNA repair exonuclease SbcCD nuclease subunit